MTMAPATALAGREALPRSRWRDLARVLAAFPVPAVGMMVLADALWCAWGGFGVAGYGGILGAVVLLLAIASVYATLRPRSALAGMAWHAALWVIFTAAGCVLTYLAATMDFPLRDAALRGADSTLGFEWAGLAGFVFAHPALAWLLRVAYFSLLLQIALSVSLHASRRPRRNAEMLGAALIALVPTVILSAVLPAHGPATVPGAPTGADLAYLPPLIALRHGRLQEFLLPVMQGIVTFPSYHAVLAAVIAASHRGRRIFWLFVAVEIVVLVATPPIGGHYLVDLLAGTAIAAVSLPLAAWLTRATPNRMA